MASLDEVALLAEQLRQKLPSPTQDFDTTLSIGAKCFIVDDENSRHLSRDISNRFESLESSKNCLQCTVVGDVVESSARKDEVTVEAVSDDSFAVEKFCSNTSNPDDEVEEDDNSSNGVVREYEANENILKAAVMGSASTFDVVNVENSNGVHFGNVTYVLGSINVTQVMQNNSATQNVFISADKGGDQMVYRASMLRIIPRRDWLAQPPLETPEPLQKPVKMVVISHTATSSGSSQAENTGIIRQLQTYDIESRDLDDIAYNFLIGMDGNVYEGRGWNCTGQHTHHYDGRSVGVAFVGCFRRQRPSKEALEAFRQLLDYGVHCEHLSTDFRIVVRCQLTTEGTSHAALYEEISSWPLWTQKIE